MVIIADGYRKLISMRSKSIPGGTVKCSLSLSTVDKLKIVSWDEWRRAVFPPAFGSRVVKNTRQYRPSILLYQVYEVCSVTFKVILATSS